MNVCYWNIHKEEKKQDYGFDECLLTILVEKSVDLFCISEFKAFDDSAILNNGYEAIENLDCEKVKFYKKRGLSLIDIRIDHRYSIIEFKSKKILFVGVHNYDQIHSGDDDRLLCMNSIKGNIDEYIEKHGETRIFVFGDFNCMPYDISIVSNKIFNCVLYRDLLKTRKNAKERYYNPMLLMLSEKERVYGSFYANNIKKNLRWYLPDQLIVNGAADKIMNYAKLEIISSQNNVELLKNNKPNINYSDHLPLFFEIKEE